MKNIKYIIVALFATAFAFTANAQGCVSGGGDVVGVHGFIQSEYNYYMNGTDANGKSLNQSTFNINRARLGVVGSIPYDVDYYVMIEYSPFTPQNKVHLLDGYVSYTRFSQWAKISVGQCKSPFSLEQNTACSGLYTVDRSEVVNQLAGPQRDLGFVVNGGNDSTFVQYSVGMMNGSGMNVKDDNRFKDIVGRVVLSPLRSTGIDALKDLKLGGSFKYGKINPTDNTQPLNEITRLGVELQYKLHGFLLQSEYILGTDKLHSASQVPVFGGCGGIVGYETKSAGTYNKSGFWVIGSYMTPWNLEPTVKFDTYMADHAVTNSRTNRITVGLNYYINDYARLQMNYINAQESAGIVNDRFVVQLQAKF